MSKSKNVISKVNVELFKKMYFYALISVSRREDKINRLNVFPVPDGDTGSNVLNTIAGGWENIKDKEFSTIAELSAAFAKGSLLGARGNSGVISSQIYKGIAVGLKDSGKTMSPTELKNAFLVAKEYAYKAVSNPIEGTILSVVSEIAKEAPKYEFDNFSTLLESVYLVADHAVMNTPNQMKVLKDANVVDSGAYSLQRFLHGFRKAVSNEEYSISEQDYTKVEEKAKRTIAKKAPTKSVAGYCTEYILTLANPNKVTKENIERELSKIGSSIVVVIDEDILKIHVHTKTPGKALDYGQTLGEFGKIKVENMDIQVNDTHIFRHKLSKNSIIAISNGNGYFGEYSQVGVSNIIDGGQGNNPSVSDLLDEIEKTNSENVFIFPNNSNIILTADHAANEYKGDKNIKVIPTKSSGQGVVLSYIFDKDEEDAKSVYDELTELLNLTTIAQISPAIKDAKIDGVSIKKDQFMTIFDKKIINANSDINLSTQNLIKKMIKDEYEIITMFYGKNMNRKDIKKTVDFVDSLDTEVEIVIKDGGQKVYNWEVVGEK